MILMLGNVFVFLVRILPKIIFRCIKFSLACCRKSQRQISEYHENMESLLPPKYRFNAHALFMLGAKFSPSHAAIKISINATAAEFICKNIFPTPVQVKKNIKNKISDIQQIYLYQNVCK